jgi:mannose-6-phosphate isomerase-like protein (cupin superfamily)
VIVRSLAEADAFTTADGSTIRELLGLPTAPVRNQSLAEATVPVGGATTAHLHRQAEELYFFTAGRGRLRVGDVEREVTAGDCAVIPPGTVHKLWNTGDEALVLLCCCAPAYSDEDTVLLEDA